jgi:hypothetical protein
MRVFISFGGNKINELVAASNNLNTFAGMVTVCLGPRVARRRRVGARWIRLNSI